jgi:diguanylate cyclase (GGDEF)-like protein/PAS domain S-box-containing protein
MKFLRASLIFKVALLVVCVEVFAFGVLGWFYIDSFNSAADQQLRSRLDLVGRLVAANELQIDSIAQPRLMSNLLGADYRGGIVIGGNERVIVSTDVTHLGRRASGIPGFDARWTAADGPGIAFIPGADTLTAVIHMGERNGGSFYHAVVTVDTAAVEAQKRTVASLGWSASFAFILFNSVIIVLLVHSFVGRRVEETLEVLKQLERGAVDARIPVASRDELGQLQHGINSMVNKIGALLTRHRRNEEELGAILDSISEGLIAIDRQGRIVRYNANAQALLGAGSPIANHTVLKEQFPAFAREAVPPWEPALAEGRPVANYQFELPRADGEPRSIEMNCSAVRDGDGTIIGAVLVLRDVTERQLAEEQLRLAASVFTHAREGIVITGPDGTIINVNQAFTEITGYSRDEAIGQNPRLLKSDHHDSEFYAGIWRGLIEEGYWAGEIWNRRKSGETYAEMLTISAVKDADGSPQLFVGLFFDITAQKEQQRQLEYIAHYDALTNLPNRVMLADRLHQSMLQTNRRGELLAVAYFDLDGFKEVNDQHGHGVGDRLLVVVAQRMKAALREGDTIARLGGDEFVAVLIDVSDVEASQPLLKRMLAAITQPVHIDALEIQVSASAGITFYPQAQEVDADQLLRQADQAMYQAKLTGKNSYVLFDAEQDRSLRGQHESVANIRKALQDGDFVLYYQPQVDMRTGETLGVEALIRWQHAERGLLLPNAFLPVIEDNPLSVELGEWVLDSAMAQLEAWHAQGLLFSVSVNVSARQLQQPDFVERLRNLLAAHPGVRPGDLKLEVLETSALNDIDHVSTVITACDRIGVSFALDDFGTGYSSLTYLKRLPAQELKIDRTFVRDMLDDPENLAILEGVLSLATAFRRQVVAEGVELREQGELLLQLGCEIAQGFGIARPMPAEQVREWHEHWRPDPSWLNQPPANHVNIPLLFAGVEFRAWIRGVERCIEGKQAKPPQLNGHHCRFGRWLDGAKREHGETAAFQAVVSLHEQVHALAVELIDRAAQEGRSKAIARLPELYALRDLLIEQLERFMREESGHAPGPAQGHAVPATVG